MLVAVYGQSHPLFAGEEQDQGRWASGLLLELGFGVSSTTRGLLLTGSAAEEVLLTISFLVGP